MKELKFKETIMLSLRDVTRPRQLSLCPRTTFLSHILPGIWLAKNVKAHPFLSKSHMKQARVWIEPLLGLYMIAVVQNIQFTQLIQ